MGLSLEPPLMIVNGTKDPLSLAPATEKIEGNWMDTPFRTLEIGLEEVGEDEGLKRQDREEPM
jgi:hypothetical protein